MLHLDAETLAALADEQPTARDAEHLRECAVCAREVEAYRALRAEGARTAAAVLDAPLTSWATLAPALRAAGLLNGADATDAGGARRVRFAPWMRVAAVIAIAVGGVLTGRVTAPGGRFEVAASTDGGSTDGGSTNGTASLVSDRASVTADGTPISSLTQALKVMERAENDYRIAAAFIASHDSSNGGGDLDRFRTRLAALDKVSDAALKAVNRSPQDPVLNQYLASARAARSATLQQLGNTLPAGVRLASY